MADFIFPIGLKQYLDNVSWSLTEEPTNILTTVDTGPKKIRRRYTRPDSIMSATLWLTADQYQMLNDFYTITLQNGTRTFSYNHPISQAETDYRFDEPIKYSTVGNNHYSATMVWRQINA